MTVEEYICGLLKWSQSPLFLYSINSPVSHTKLVQMAGKHLDSCDFDFYSGSCLGATLALHVCGIPRAPPLMWLALANEKKNLN
jgi:hypothetical protein